jgi:hypothetical protein
MMAIIIYNLNFSSSINSDFINVETSCYAAEAFQGGKNLFLFDPEFQTNTNACQRIKRVIVPVNTQLQIFLNPE